MVAVNRVYAARLSGMLVLGPDGEHLVEFVTQGITKKQRDGLEDIILRMTRSASWKETLEREGWKSVVLVGDEYDQFLKAETERVTAVVKELGIGKVE